MSRTDRSPSVFRPVLATMPVAWAGCSRSPASAALGPVMVSCAPSAWPWRAFRTPRLTQIVQSPPSLPFPACFAGSALFGSWRWLTRLGLSVPVGPFRAACDDAVLPGLPPGSVYRAK